MPASRRTSGYGGGTFGMDKLSISVLEPGRKEWADEDDVAESKPPATATSKTVQFSLSTESVSHLVNDDDMFESKHLSVASAALDLASSSRKFARPSDWTPLGRLTTDDASVPRELLTSRSPSAGLADSIASLPAMPSKSVPSTPFGLGPTMPPTKRSSPGIDSLSQRGFSNPDLARAFSSKGGMNDAPRPYGADPLYSNMGINNFQGGGYDNYGFDDDNFGSGGLYPGMMGLKNKRPEADREFNRFSGMRLEDLQGEILSLCKDQHGCRYLQKKLEEGDPAHRDMIFRETYGHFPELMIDPFGNYLCQKLLEHATEEQRSAIIDSVSNDLVGISLNMHGTRAVQKMVDFLAQPRQPKQIRTLIYALSVNVVALIKDLNGNHVIQKCLNKLIPEDNQFIYNAIATNLIEVATHRPRVPCSAPPACHRDHLQLAVSRPGPLR
jgi:hypothetical protein